VHAAAKKTYKRRRDPVATIACIASKQNLEQDQNNMKRIIIACVAIAAFAAPAFAAEPNGEFIFKDNKDYKSIENLIGQYSAQIIQNGQFVSGNDGTYDQTTTPGSRAAAVQALQASQGRGRDAVK
jgi:hypothetical protein